MTYRTLQNIITTFDRSDIPLEKITFWLNRNAVHDNKHGNNYKNFTLQDTIACTLITQHNDIVGLSTIMEREYWPYDTYRVLSRYFILPKYRAGYQKHIPMNARTISMLDQQVFFLKRRKAQTCFFTLHAHKPRWCKMLVEYLNGRSKNKWYMEDKLCKIADGSDDTCYQHVIFTGEKIDWINR